MPDPVDPVTTFGLDFDSLMAKAEDLSVYHGKDAAQELFRAAFMEKDRQIARLKGAAGPTNAKPSIVQKSGHVLLPNGYLLNPHHVQFASNTKTYDARPGVWLFLAGRMKPVLVREFTVQGIANVLNEVAAEYERSMESTGTKGPEPRPQDEKAPSAYPAASYLTPMGPPPDPCG